MQFNPIYEVDREDYKAWFSQFKNEYRYSETMNVDEQHDAIVTYRKETRDILAARVYSIVADYSPERYYIYELPRPEETKAPQPVMKIVLDNPQDVQKFFDYLRRTRDI